MPSKSPSRNPLTAHAHRCPNNWMTVGQPLSVKRSAALALRSGSTTSMVVVSVCVCFGGGNRVQRKRVDGRKSMCLKQGTSSQRTGKVRSETRKAAANFSLKHFKIRRRIIFPQRYHWLIKNNRDSL